MIKTQVEIQQIHQYLNQLLSVDDIQDYCPNGLQISGKSKVHKIVSGVSANLQLIEQAIQQQADVLLVHHGFFWRGEEPELVGIKGKRIQTIIQHQINLLAYHLPLDIHPTFGNNAIWGEMMQVKTEKTLQNNLVHIGRLPRSMPSGEFAQYLETILQRKPLHLSGGNHHIQTIAWCSGAAQDYIQLFENQQLTEHNLREYKIDAYLSGEVSERTPHLAKELNTHYFCCGHHATEVFGVQKLGEHLSKKFNIQHQFINIPNPI